ncbi:MAG TPA: hypothetical protein VI542_13635 [Candidatus Tectomicrobia bacterium]
MTSKRVILSLWLGVLTLLWSCQPLLISSARGIVVLALFTGVLAGLGALTGLRVLVVWSGGLGMLNLTLALLLTGSPPYLWTGLSAGLTLLALLDGNQCVAYLWYCEVGPGVLTELCGTLIRLSGWSLAAGVSVGYLVTVLYTPHLATAAAGYVTILGAGIFVGFLAAFLLTTSHWSTLRTQDDWDEKDG